LASLGVPSFEGFAEGTEKQLRQIGDEIRKEYLQHFTRPIWEREEHEENG